MQRGADVDVDRLVELDAQLRDASARATRLRGQQRQRARGQAGRGVGQDPGQDPGQDELRAVTDEVRALQELSDELWGQVPNLLAADTPAGPDAGGNVELRRAGDPVAADDARSSDVVGPALGILVPGTDVPDIDVEAAARWQGDGARLTWAVFTHAQTVLQAGGSTPVLTPPGGREDLVSGYRDQIVDAAGLPIRLAAFCSHPVQAVEQVVLCRPEDAERRLDECQRHAEQILRDLELPYRVVRVCAGALAAPEHKSYHTECWFPGAGAFRRTHSAALLTDYQTRRLRIRYLDCGRVAQPHTVLATGVTDRAVLAVLENHVQPDGSVRIPAALRRYLGGQELIEPAPA